MNTPLKATIAACLISVAITQPLYADDTSPATMQQLSTEWAVTTYQTPETEQSRLLYELTKKAKQAVRQNPDDAELLTWAAIISASYAGSRGGLGALKIATKAKTQLERAMEIDPEALNGGARTSLGALYYQVPGWPIGFGNSKKAEQLLGESAEKHPHNINALYFYADFLLEQKRFNEAKNLFEKAAKIAPDEQAILSHQGRLSQIQEKLALLEKITS